jgi:mannose-6-phosphate isomerase-like protein (cupin superfamily)
MGTPVLARLADIPVREIASGEERFRVWRLLTHDSSGSNLMLGVMEMRPGERAGFRCEDGVQETYYLLSGSLRVRDDGGESTEVGAETAVLFPRGEYRLEALGGEPARIIYTVMPDPTASA